MRTIRAAAVLALVAITAGGAAAAELEGGRRAPALEVLHVPPPYAVCVVTTDAAGLARLDSYWSTEPEAELRRLEVVRDGWITGRPLPGEVSQPDRTYQYGPAALVKAFVDPTLVNESACMPPAPVAEAEPLEVPAGELALELARVLEQALARPLERLRR